MDTSTPFKWRHFQAEIILLCVRWYLRYPLSYRDLEEMMRERRLHIDHTTIYRWAQCYAPELEKRCRPHLKVTNDSWRVDETYVKVKKVWMYLYRTVDSQGHNLEFLLSPTRDAQAASASSRKRLLRSIPALLESLQLIKTRPIPKRGSELKAEGIMPEPSELRQCKYLNNLVEQDHRFLKRLVKLGMGFFSFETAWRTLQGYETMNMVRKGQICGVEKRDSMKQVKFIASLFGAAV